MAGLINTLGQTWNLVMAGGFLSSMGFIWVDMVTIPLMLWALCYAEEGKRLSARQIQKIQASSIYLWSVFILSGTLVGLWYGMKHFTKWYVEFESDADISDWDARGSNFESELVYVWLAWSLVDLGVCYRYGSFLRNWRLSAVAAVLYAFVFLADCLAVCGATRQSESSFTLIS
jgi:hypothetical protein